MTCGGRSGPNGVPLPAHGPRYRVPYGTSLLEFAIPPTMRVTVAASQPTEPLKDAEHAVIEALAHPIGSRPLREQAKPGMRVCVVFTDSTRACPDHLLVPALLAELDEAGIRDEDITLLCGVGLHRPSTPEEKITKLGAAVAARYRVIDSDPRDPSTLADLGQTPGGVPVQVHRAAVDARLVIATGVVEPHQLAGYSGGAKTLAVGAAGEGLIAYTHGPALVDHPGTRLGRIDGNPFREIITEAARRAGLRFILNVVLDDDKRILRVSAGHPELAFEDLVAFARPIYEVSIPHAYDIAVGGAGFPKDANLYQASRVASYLALGPTPAVRQGGYLIIPARCQEGAGSGAAEQRFLSALGDAPDLHSILETARRIGYPPGQQRAFVMAKVLERARVVVVGSECPDLVAACKMIPAETMEAALGLAAQELGQFCSVLVVPHALLTLPVVGPRAP